MSGLPLRAKYKHFQNKELDISIHRVRSASLSPAVLQPHVRVQVPVLVRRLQKNDELTSLRVLSALLPTIGFFQAVSQCATRLTSVLESCGHHAVSPTTTSLSVFGGCFGWWYVREHACEEAWRQRGELPDSACIVALQV